jgi:hypothetical protein
MGRETLPANEIARIFEKEQGKDDARLDFVCYIEGRERSEDAVVANLDRFLTTPNRSKWDFGLP